MTGTDGTAEMFVNMLLATGILIGAVAVLIVVGFVVYHRTAGDRHDIENAP